MIELRNVTHRYSKALVLDNFSLRVDKGYTHVLLGSSGCGKSTVLKLILGLTTPTQGSIFFDSHPLKTEDFKSVRSRIGYCPQEGSLFPHLSMGDNIQLAAKSLGIDRIEGRTLKERTTELFDLFRLKEEFLRRYPSELSGGQRQRVALARALFLDPDLLLLDEPFSALDPIVRMELHSELKEIFARLKKTVLLVTHDLKEAAYLAQNISLLRNGKILASGSYQEIAQSSSDDYIQRFFKAQQLEEVS